MHNLIIFIQKEIKKHVLDYLMLFTAGIFFIISLHVLRGERLLQFIMIFVFTSFYIIWGLYHHLIHDKLHLKIVLEYIFIGFMIMFLLTAVIISF